RGVRRGRRATSGGPPRRRVALDVSVRASVGEALALEGRTETGFRARVAADSALAEAERLPASSESIREQIDRLGGTPYTLRDLEVAIEGGPMVPKSLLNGLRRALVAALDEATAAPPTRRVAGRAVLPALRAAIAAG